MEELVCDECPVGPARRGQCSRQQLFHHSLAMHGLGRARGLFPRQKKPQPAKRLFCDACGTAFHGVKPRSTLTSHIRSIHPKLSAAGPRVKLESQGICDGCSRTFASKINLLGHRCLPTGSRIERKAQMSLRVVCDECGRTLDKRTLARHCLCAHSSRHTASQLRAIMPRKAPQPRIVCEDCGQSCLPMTLWPHWTLKHGQRSELVQLKRPHAKLHCDDCGGRLVCRSDLQAHWRRRHR